MSATRTVTEQLADVLVEEGCDRIFTLMGAGNLWLIHHLGSDHGVAVHHLRHENGAVGAADGFARATGRIGWCTVTQGPGFTNTITALLTAARGRVPMVLLVSDTSNLDAKVFPFAGGVQALPPESILDPLGIESVRADGVHAAAQLREVADRVLSERCTIVFVLPAGLDRVEAEFLSPRASQSTRSVAVAAAGAAVTAAARVLAQADRPVVLAGNGAVYAEAGDEVVALAEQLGAYMTTTVPASGLIGDHPLAAGQFGGFSTGATERVIAEADVLITIGASLNTFQTRKGEFLKGKTVVRIDTDADERSASDADKVYSLIGDARLTSAALRNELARLEVSRSAPPPVARPSVSDDRSLPGAIDPRSLSLEFDRLLPRERRVFVDNGHFGAFPMIYLTHRAPRSLVWLPDFGAVGSALAASYASATADDSVQSVLFIGDCGLYITLGDLETAVRERTPLIVVCMNDGAAGSELVHMSDWGVPPEQAIFGYNDIAELARGMGAQGALIRDLSDLESALRGWSRDDGPLVLDCHVSREVRSPIYDHV